ncbi:unnamed protein product [Phytophthora lilii]|uniref:Unnamed protein product n=1 Tax=Phytophthora lilii TaxID=2077276 RepID=A0A9W6X907_9STRA|nr:unnamed protein product [Phytophthora lilii]
MAPPKAEKTVHGVAPAQAAAGQDANGITTGRWSSPIVPEEPESCVASNLSVEACCPCAPLAQIEVRLGRASYAGALAGYAAAFALLAAAVTALWLLVALWIYSPAYRDGTSVAARVLLLLAALLLAALPALLLVHRISSLRAAVRERFDIPGSIVETARPRGRRRRAPSARCGGTSRSTGPSAAPSARCRPTSCRAGELSRQQYTLLPSSSVSPAALLGVMRLDGVLPTALEALQQRRDSTRKLQEIDELLRDDADEVPVAAASSAAKSGCSFGSGRTGTKSARYWRSMSASAPGPGAYAVSNADSLIKPNAGGGGALGLRSSVCCRFQPCECKKPRHEQEEAVVSESDINRQDTKQPRRPSPSLVAYSRPASSEPDFESLEQQRRIAAVQAAKQRWKHLGSQTTPNYRWTERRNGAGGALSMSRSTSRDGTGNSAAKARLRKLLSADKKSHKCEAEDLRLAKTAKTAASAAAFHVRTIPGPAVDMKRLLGRDAVRCKRKNQRVVMAFGK